MEKRKKFYDCWPHEKSSHPFVNKAPHQKLEFHDENEKSSSELIDNRIIGVDIFKNSSVFKK